MRLSPATFWAMSLPEWRAALGARAPRPSLSRADLDRLIALYPDHAHA